MNWSRSVALALTVASIVSVGPAGANDFPEKGRTITMIVPFSAGGSTDVSARILAAGLEKELGTTVQVVNKPGAGSQLAVTDLLRARPDGYTIGYLTLPHVVTLYTDRDRQAPFSRKDLVPIAMHASDPQLLTVSASSPYKTAKELIDAARAQPGKIKGAAVGILGPEHLAMLQIERATGARFAKVQFDGGAPAMAAVLGDHVDFYTGTLGVFASAAKANTVRFLGVLDSEKNPLTPDVPTLASQGFEVLSYISRIVTVRAGTPQPIIDRLSSAIKKVTESEDHKARILAMGLTLRYMSPTETARFWDQVEATVSPLIPLGKQ